MFDSVNRAERDVCLSGQDEFPTLLEIDQAASRLREHIAPTPVHRYALCDESLERRVCFKHENHHEIGAFKVRGALVHLNKLRDQGVTAVVTASTGNHGLGVAEAARQLGMSATIVVPQKSNPRKLQRIRALSASVIERGKGFESARLWALENAAVLGARFVNTTESNIIAGAGTYASEFLSQCEGLDAMVVPIGGGSGACGCIIAASAHCPEVPVIGVQSSQAPAVYESWRSGVSRTMPSRAFAEGIAVERPFENTLGLLRRSLADFVLASDDEIRVAQRKFFEWAGELIEGAAAAPIAALICGRVSRDFKKVGVIITGRNLSENEALLALNGTDRKGKVVHG